MKLIIDIPDEEYKTFSELSEKEKVNELSYYERIIANGIPYEERPTGHWEKAGPNMYHCSHCGAHEEINFAKFCWLCGARMEAENE